MSKSISQLSVSLLGDVGGFSHAFGKTAVGSVNSFIGSVAKMTGVLGVASLVQDGLEKVGAAIADGFGTREQFAAIDANSKLADRLGMSTEALTGFQHAASLAGVSNETLTGGFDRMFKTLGDAANGMAEPVKYLNQLGLSAAKLQAEAPEQAFKDIAEKIAAIQNPAQRAAATMNIFGRSGGQLLPLLSGGAKGIAEAQEEAQKLGLTFSRVDGAKIEAANDAITRLKGGFTGIARSAAIALAPFVTEAATKLTGWLEIAIPVIQSGLTKVGAFFANLLDVVAPVMSNLWGIITSVWDNVYGYLAGVAAAIYDAVAPRWEAIVESITANMMAYWDMVTAVWGATVDLAGTVWQGVVEAWDWGVSLITGASNDAAAGTQVSFGSIVDTFNWLRDEVTLVFNAVEYSITHWRDYFEMAGTTVALIAVRTANQIQYALQEVAATYVGYAIAVMGAKIGDFASYTGTVMSNLVGNMVSIFKNLPAIMSGNADWSKIWTPLTKGFESTVIQWPGIADREKSELEKQLEDENGYLQNQFAQGLGDHIAKRQSEAHNAAGGIIKGLKNIFNFKGQKVTPPKIPTAKFNASVDPKNLALKIKPQVEANKALRTGSAEAQLAQYAGPQLAAIANAPAKASAAPIPASALPDGVAAAGKPGWDRTKVDKSLDWLRRIELNTRNPQLAASSI